MATFDSIVDEHIRRWVLRYQLYERGGRKGKGGKPEPLPAVTISRSIGSGGRAIAEMAANDLGYRLYDSQIIDAISKSTKVKRKIVEALDEGPLASMTALRDGIFDRRILDSRSYVHSLTRVVRSIVRLEPAVFLGRGAFRILKDDPEILHVRITAPLKFRVERVRKREALSKKKALERVQSVDRIRRRFIKSLFGCDTDDPTQYHLVINTGRIAFPEAAAIMVSQNRPKRFNG